MQYKIQCPLCKSKIPSDAVRCSHCAGDLSTDEIQGKIKKQIKRQKITIGLFTILIILIIFIVNNGKNSTPAPTNSPTQNTTQTQKENTETPPEDQLELLSFRCYEEYGYFIIEGEVKNISSESLKSVEAVGTTYTETGEFVKSSEALIEYDPILPGQTSPFKVMMTTNPAITKCNVGFKEFWGTTIPTKRK